MKAAAVRAILEAAGGMTRREWDQVAEMVTRQYDAAARAVQFDDRMAEAAMRALINECGAEGAAVPEGNRQTRMF